MEQKKHLSIAGVLGMIILALAVGIGIGVYIGMKTAPKKASDSTTTFMDVLEIDFGITSTSPTEYLTWDMLSECGDGCFHTFGSDILRDQVRSIEFINESEADSEIESYEWWDVSADENESIRCYAVPLDVYVSVNDEYKKMYDLYIVSGQKIKLCKDARATFADFYNMERLEFNDMLDTSDVTDMTYMFFYCSSLKELDLTGFQCVGKEGSGCFQYTIWQDCELEPRKYTQDES